MLHRWRSCYGLAGLKNFVGRPSQLCESFPRPFRPRRQLLQLSTISAAKAISTSAPLQSGRQRRKDTIPTADTIYALSTAAGRAAIAIIRISGPACLDIYGSLCPNTPFPHPRVATLRRLKDPNDHTRILDTGALVLYFPSPKTVTGDDVLELHLHGGTAIVRSVLEAIPRCIDSRPRRRTAEYSLIRAAEPGEFTRRAFYNGQIDLTQAEALGETLAAETEQQRRLAVAGADSGLATRYEKWRQNLLYARGELEALIDFSEDQHFDESPAVLLKSVSAQVGVLLQQIKLHIHNASRGELLRSGISVALLGAPNAGKSSLLNQIVGREAAIVSAEAGTTRDIVDVSIDISGWLVRLGDMAGLRGGGKDHRVLNSASTTDEPPIGQVEHEGIRRARERALQSDVVIVVVSLLQGANGAVELSLNPELDDAVEECDKAGKAMLFVINKTDLLPLENRFDTGSGLRQRIINMFPAAHENNVFLLSCRNAAAASLLSTLTTSSVAEQSDPGGVQTFLSGLAHTFTTMTSALTESDLPQTTAIGTLTPAESQSYWAASLSVTHRQSMYLQDCCSHLEDFLAECSTSPDDTRMDHHVDGHHDLVGEKAAPFRESRGDEQGHFDIVTMAESLRYAADCLSRITGRGGAADVEDVLGVVFEK